MSLLGSLTLFFSETASYPPKNVCGFFYKVFNFVDRIGVVMMSSSLPKTVISSPSQSEAHSSTSVGTTNSLLSILKFEEAAEKSKVQLLERDAHQKRLKQLRKELDYLQNTAWKYQPIENYIGK